MLGILRWVGRVLRGVQKAEASRDLEIVAGRTETEESIPEFTAEWDISSGDFSLNKTAHSGLTVAGTAADLRPLLGVIIAEDAGAELIPVELLRGYRCTTGGDGVEDDIDSDCG